jgi:hypothetical protein
MSFCSPFDLSVSFVNLYMNMACWVYFISIISRIVNTNNRSNHKLLSILIIIKLFNVISIKKIIN